MENLMEIYNRTYRNCQFYREQGMTAHLLNEIGVLRGIQYSIEAAVGTGYTYRLIDFSEYHEMIDEQVKMLREEK